MPFTEIEGRKVYYELHACDGGSANPPLVLITGLSGSCRGWQPLQVPEFSRSRDTLIFDNRGTGQSEDSNQPFSIADLAADTESLLRTLDLGQVDVLGASMGGMVAQELALQWPERIRRLILVGTYARPDAKRRMLLDDWAQLVRAGVPTADLTRSRLLWTLQDETLEQTDLIEMMLDFFQRNASPTSPDLFARQCEACIGHDAMDRLRDIRHTTLVVCGRHDQLTPPKFHRELADEIPAAHLVTLSYGGHLVMAESAERFNEVVVQFLDD